MSVLRILKTIDGEFEISRVLGSFGTGVYIVATHIFMALDFQKNGHFDVTAYCLAFPGGLGVAIASIAGSVALKERKQPNGTVSDNL